MLRALSGPITLGVGSHPVAAHRCGCLNDRAAERWRPYLRPHQDLLLPVGGLPITLGGCDHNLWGAVEAGSSADDPNGDTEWLNNDFATPHFNVCENSPGVLSVQSA